MKPITVVLADDNQLVREEFRRILEREEDFEVVGEASNGRAAVAMVKKLLPALVLMDITMPVLNGLLALKKILKAVPATNVLMVSVHDEEAYVEAATQSGARGYLLKHTAADLVCGAMREVQKGNTFFSPTIPRSLSQRKQKKPLA